MFANSTNAVQTIKQVNFHISYKLHEDTFSNDVLSMRRTLGGVIYDEWRVKVSDFEVASSTADVVNYLIKVPMNAVVQPHEVIGPFHLSQDLMVGSNEYYIISSIQLESGLKVEQTY